MIVNNRSNPRRIANTIIAGKDTSITNDNAAPTNNPITKVNAVNNIVATINKQFFFLLHFSSLLS